MTENKRYVVEVGLKLIMRFDGSLTSIPKKIELEDQEILVIEIGGFN